MRIAIIGAGVAGLTAAHRLHPDHEITVFEAGDHVGGHTNTIDVDLGGRQWAVDTGFIVCNDRTYPHFLALLDELGVGTQDTHMGFSVSDGADFEYAGTPRGAVCSRANVTSVSYWRMLGELRRFNGEMAALLQTDEDADTSLGEFLRRGRYSRMFVERLIVPQASAVWSAPPVQMQSFPVRFLAEFFRNHGMLGFRDRPQWMTVVGGSARYVDALTAPFADQIRTRTPVQAVTRADTHVDVVTDDGVERFDEVVLACHADQALGMLTDADACEREILGALPYQPNEAVLHTDERLLPRREAARQAWNFHLLSEPKDRTTVTYSMNRLQRLDAPVEFCVTLNLTERIDPAHIIATVPYAHPVYTPDGIAAQGRHHEISGVRRTHYAGAYWRWGFHEDGVWSGLRAVEHVGVSRPERLAA